MSLAEQLSISKVSSTNIFDTNIKNKKSLYFEDGASLSRAETFVKCKEGFHNLCILEKKFKLFKCLFEESDINVPFSLKKEDEFNATKKLIKHFLYLSTDYLEINCTLQALEWLILKYEAHLHQPEDLLIACIPLHERPVFVKFAHLFNMDKKEFSWLKVVVDSGRGINQADICTICLKNPHILQMICDWPIMILSVTENDKKTCLRMYRTILSLGIQILDKVKLRGSDKIEKYITPFTIFINDGLKSKNSDFVATASLILVYMSHHISLNVDFLNECIKLLLKSNEVKNYTCLRTVLDLMNSQDFVSTEKIENLMKVKIGQLNELELKSIDAYMITTFQENEDECEAMDISEPSNSNHNILSVVPHQVKDSTKIQEAVTLNIDWSSTDIENQLVDILKTYILTWSNKNEERINTKISLVILGKVKQKPKTLKFEYSHGGLASFLCVALLSRNHEIRKAIKRIISKFIINWPQMDLLMQVGKNELVSDSCLIKGITGFTLLTEINAICSTEAQETIRLVALSSLNKDIFCNVPSLNNIWTLFLSQLSSYANKSSALLHEEAVLSLISIKEVFLNLKIEHQHAILDSIFSGIDSSTEVCNRTINILRNIDLSLESVKYLLREVNPPSSDNSSVKRKSIKKFTDSDENNEEFYSETVIIKVMVTLGALSNITTIPALDQIQLIHPLFSILRKTFKNKNKAVHQNHMISLLTNLMSSLLNVLSSIESLLTREIKDSLTLKIRIEDISKCLYMFKNSNLHNVILMVIKKLVKLELGLDHFNLTYFMNWIGSNVVPRDDQHSMDILNSVLEEILSVCIRNKQQSEDIANDQVKIIASFVKDCAGIPKHRLLMLYYNLIKSISTLSTTETCSTSSILWIQLIFMVINKENSELSTGKDLNTFLILPLLKKFNIQEQLLSMKKVIAFLSNILNDNNKKRKFVSDDMSNSPIQKKRKTALNSECTSEYKKSEMAIANEFVAVKEHLKYFNRNIDYTVLLKTMITYFKMQLTESQEDMNMVPKEVLINVVSRLFSSMKAFGVNQSHVPCSIATKNEITTMIRDIIETVGVSLAQNVYLTLLINLVKNDNDESIKIKSLELLSNKLLSISHETNIDLLNEEFLEIVTSVLIICKGFIISNSMINSWDYSVCCATSIITMGFLEQDDVNDIFGSIYNTLLTNINANLSLLSAERVILINIFFKAYVAGDNGNELKNVLMSALQIMNSCLEKKQLNNGEIESSLSLIHTILSREDAEAIGWESMELLLSSIFELTTLEYVLRKLSKASLDYQKNIRTKLSKLKDTQGLIQTCIRLYDIGCIQSNLTFISGSINLFGCHLAFLRKIHIKWHIDDEKQTFSEDLQSLVYKSLSIKENMEVSSEVKDDLRMCEEVSIKALNQMCILFDYDQEVLAKLMSWSEDTPDVLRFMHRNSLIYRLVHHMTTTKSEKAQIIIDFINNSSALTKASAILKHLTSDLHKTKKKKVSIFFTIPYAQEQFVKSDPTECVELVKAILLSLRAHFYAEQKLNLNLDISEESKDLINNVCNTLTFMESFVDRDEYSSMTEKIVIPVIVQLAINAYSGDSLLEHLCKSLCKDFNNLSENVHLTILKTFVSMKEELGASFDINIRGHISSFLEDSKLHNDETIADIANEI